METCSLVLADKFVSSLHARIRCTGDGVSIQDCSTNGTWLNGQKLPQNFLRNETRVLQHNDELAFEDPASGRQKLCFRFEANPFVAAAAALARSPAAGVSPCDAALYR